MFNPYDELFDPSDPGNFSDVSLQPHPPCSRCQCARCARLFTITMWDRDFLYSIGVAWNKRDVHVDRKRRETVPEPQEGDVRRTPAT